MTKKIKVKDHKEKAEFNNLVATPQDGKQSTIIIDQLGLALLLMNVYGQRPCGVDWTHRHGDMFIFVDNPIVRSCIALWREAIRVNDIMGNDIMTLTERYLFNLLHDEDHDLFCDLQGIEEEKRKHREEFNELTSKGDITNG